MNNITKNTEIIPHLSAFSRSVTKGRRKDPTVTKPKKACGYNAPLIRGGIPFSMIGNRFFDSTSGMSNIMIINHIRNKIGIKNWADLTRTSTPARTVKAQTKTKLPRITLIGVAKRNLPTKNSP